MISSQLVHQVSDDTKMVILVVSSQPPIESLLVLLLLLELMNNEVLVSRDLESFRNSLHESWCSCEFRKIL